ncbi:MAG TPA: hemerythrin domain-containing protein [Ktedonobacterales bacterium]|nr:hemerythrin domain-containing protein [Ktedonobacterales bacterium]
MGILSDAMREHHRELAERLASQVAALEGGPAAGDPEALVAFLEGELLPHAAGEEAHLYPVVDPLVAQHGRPTATMSVDHEYIAAYVRQIGATTRALRTADAAQRAALWPRLVREVARLDGLFAAHLAKEERIYLPLLDRYVASEGQRDLLERLHETPAPR